jgi:hypothetical protein
VTADDDNDNDDNNGGGAGAGLLGGLARGIGGLVEDVAPLAALANRSSWVTAHIADEEDCPNCDGAGCAQCECPNCGNETDAYGGHYRMFGCPAGEDARFASGNGGYENMVQNRMEDCPNCGGAGCAQCGHCPNCGNEVDAYGDHYGMISCPADEDDRFASGTASNEWPHIELGQHVHGDCPYCSGGNCPTCNDIAPGKNYDGSIHGFNPMGIDDHDMGDMARHDQGHDDWHAMYGDEPCTSEEDCAAKRSRYDNIDNMRDKGEPVKETDLHDALHEKWHRDHGDEPCTSIQDCARKSARYND